MDAQYSLGPCARLSCEMCKQRKVKCDKLRPCTNCRKSNLACVPVERARLPRGLSGKKKQHMQEAAGTSQSNLSERVSMLEALIQTLQSDRGESSINSRLPLISASPEGLHHSALLSIDSGYSNANTSVVTNSTLDGSVIQAVSHLDRCLTQSASKDQNPAALFNTIPSEANARLSTLCPRLLQIFVEQVDPILPILPYSRLWGYITGEPYLNYAVDHPAPKALLCAINYMTISSTSNDQCFQEFKIQRHVLLARHHNLTQRALEKADYVNTNDITVLQAFVLFLVSMQAHDQSRRAWTMLSLALRIAQSLFLDKLDPPFRVTPLEREMRRRLWHIISLLDVQASFDRGSAPMLNADCLQTQILPALDIINFFSPLTDDNSTSPGLDSFTKPTFMIIMVEAQNAFRSLHPPRGLDSSMASIDIQYRMQIAAAFQQKSRAILQGYESDKIAFHWFLERLIEVTHAFLQLVAIQPMHGNTHVPRDFISESTSLSLAVKFLQALNQLHQDIRMEPFRWYIRLFVPWHAFSVAMDCICTCNDELLQDYYQSLILGLYSSFQELLGDAHQSLLQQSLHRLTALTLPSVSQSLSSNSIFNPIE